MTKTNANKQRARSQRHKNGIHPRGGIVRQPLIPPQNPGCPASTHQASHGDKVRVATANRLTRLKSKGWSFYKNHGTCGNCGDHGHSVMDCLRAAPDGFVHACSICNMSNHTISQCCNKVHADLFEELVLNRGNKPPMLAAEDWFLLWLSKGLPATQLPWSVEFSKKIAREDPATMAGLGSFSPSGYAYRHPCNPQAETSFYPRILSPSTTWGSHCPGLWWCWPK